MNYQGTINRVDTSKALALLNLEGNQQGACIKYQCHKCGKQAVIKAYREKKNFCNNEFSAYSDKFRSEAIAPMQNNVGQFLSSSLMRNIIGQKSQSINHMFFGHIYGKNCFWIVRPKEEWKIRDADRSCQGKRIRVSRNLMGILRNSEIKKTGMNYWCPK